MGGSASTRPEPDFSVEDYVHPVDHEGVRVLEYGHAGGDRLGIGTIGNVKRELLMPSTSVCLMLGAHPSSNA